MPLSTPPTAETRAQVGSSSLLRPMCLDALLFQALNGLAAASGLFFVAVGLSLIFGVTRIINIAHGSLYMLGTYIAYSFATKVGGGLGFWGGIVAAALIVGRASAR